MNSSPRKKLTTRNNIFGKQRNVSKSVGSQKSIDLSSPSTAGNATQMKKPKEQKKWARMAEEKRNGLGQALEQNQDLTEKLQVQILNFTVD